MLDNSSIQESQERVYIIWISLSNLMESLYTIYNALENSRKTEILRYVRKQVFWKLMIKNGTWQHDIYIYSSGVMYI